jgi:chromosome segregation ATPase
MKKLVIPHSRTFLLAALCSVGALSPAQAQEADQENARSLLLELKQRDLERQVVSKQREIERTNGDLRLARMQAQKLQESIDATNSLMGDTATYLEQLQAQKTRLEQVVELTSLRIDAERQKVDGLKALGEAQFKALESVIKHIEETETRANLVNAELKILSDTPNLEPVAEGPGATRTPPEIVELRKKAAAEKTALAALDKSAGEAMRSAALKLEAADVAAIKAKRKAIDLGLDEKLPAGAEKAPAEKTPADR